METPGQDIERNVFKVIVAFKLFQFLYTAHSKVGFCAKVNQRMVHAFFIHFVKQLQHRIVEFLKQRKGLMLRDFSEKNINTVQVNIDSCRLLPHLFLLVNEFHLFNFVLREFDFLTPVFPDENLTLKQVQKGNVVRVL
jgi:hypothetical protein